MPSTPTFWDFGNNGTSDPGVIFKLASNDALNYPWLSNMVNRAQTAMDQWHDFTDWDPILNTVVAGGTCFASTSCHGIFSDGDCGAWAPNAIAINCYLYTPRHDPIDNELYYDLYDAEIYLRLTEDGGPNWSWASTWPGGNVFDAQGILTHEIGHSVFLRDLYNSDCPTGQFTFHTMCGLVDPTKSFWERSLTADDRAGADATY